MKKIKLYAELDYLLAILILSLSVAMISCTDFGLSMIVAPAYLLSQKLGVAVSLHEGLYDAQAGRIRQALEDLEGLFLRHGTGRNRRRRFFRRYAGNV